MKALRSICDRPALLSKIIELKGHRDRLLQKLKDFGQGNLENSEVGLKLIAGFAQ
jgi:hypothetical protein